MSEKKRETSESIGFSMSPFGYVVTLKRGPDGAYGCDGRDGCYGKFWQVDESFMEFKARIKEHVDAAH